MAIPIPNLDDRHFQDLVDEAKRRIPYYCPEWTDHNVSDPGVTLIELFAGMVDALIYRLNRVPDKSYLAFMDLMGIQLDPPAPARAALTFVLSAPLAGTDVAPVIVPADTEVETRQTAAEDGVRFSTDAPLTIFPAQTAACLTAPDEQTFANHLLEIADGFEPFAVFRAQPQAGDALYLGDVHDLSAHVLAVAFDFAPVEGLGIRPDRPPLRWDAWCATGWQPVELELDETGGLNRDGRMLLHLPDGMQQRMLHVGGAACYWIRIRALAGTAEMPGYSASPRVRRLRVFTLGGRVRATHATRSRHELLGRSTGAPGQRFRLEYAPVLPRRADEQLDVQRADGSWQTWHEVDRFGPQTGPEDCSYTLDSVSGEIAFGPLIREPNGTERQYGALPAAGAALRMRQYRSGGGARGNIGARAIEQLKSTVPFVDRVTNRHAASGGRDSETIDHARLRAPHEIKNSTRAVTPDDFAYLALRATPAVCRAVCLQQRASDAGTRAGVVTVLLVPDLPDPARRIAQNELQPLNRQLADTVERYLDERRLLTTELVIGSPSYTIVVVRATLRASPNVQLETLQRDAEARLYQFLNPIVGGPTGDGWPFGRALYVSEVYAVLQNTPGLGFIEEVQLLIDGSPLAAPQTDLAADALVLSGTHQLTVKR